MKLIAVRPKTDALRHYLELEAECKNASPLADASKPHLYPTPIAGEGAVSAGGAADLDKTLREIALAKAMRCAEFEARHMGPFNYSGKKSTRQID